MLPTRQLPNIKKQFPHLFPSLHPTPWLYPSLPNNLLSGLCVALFIVSSVCDPLPSPLGTLPPLPLFPQWTPKKVFECQESVAESRNLGLGGELSEQMEMQMGNAPKDLRGSRFDTFRAKCHAHSAGCPADGSVPSRN